MSTTLLTPHATPHFGPPTGSLLEALHDALISERRLLDELIAQMRRQRTAVSSDDIDGVDDSTFATHRILATLGQARQRRRQLNLLLSGNEDCTLRDLEELLGDQIDNRLRDARLRLQQAADVLTREVGMNRKLLREALASNDQHVRTLAGGPATTSTYAMEKAAPVPTDAPRGLLVNRTV
ncbi:MAG: flagellar export chaperone FlgN [Gemmatimonadaceae bacterium]|jgi:FlgN protein|nr:flagellar export chaperone FlgN [Gemmatimonadaceae bacterium]